MGKLKFSIFVEMFNKIKFNIMSKKKKKNN